jgi:error-prone DNA polymerase
MSLDEADRFRSLMSKFRSPTEMESMRERFVAGAVVRGVKEPSANLVFDRVAHFVGYGFCRSHAAAFARTVYHSAWLKLYHPAAFMASLMQHRPGMYSLSTLEQEAMRCGVPVLMPEINRSGIRYGLECNAEGAWAIRKPLVSIAGLSSDDACAIVLERTRGEFTSLEDFYTRVSLSRDVLDNLAMSGALDALGRSSRGVLWEIGALASRLGPSGEARREMLFDLPALEEADIPALPELGVRERLTWDYLTHGSPRRHPMTLARRALNDLEIRSISTCSGFTESALRPASQPYPVLTIAGIVILRQMPPTANGVQFITLEDETGFIQCIVYPGVQKRYRDILHKGAFIVRGEVQIAGAWRGMIIRQMWELDGMLGGYEGRPSASGGMDRLVVGRRSEQRTSKGEEGLPIRSQ